MLVVVLVLSNIGLGLLSAYLMRQADRRYSELIDESVPVLADLQTITATAAHAMVSTNLDRMAGSDAKSFAETCRATLAADSALRTAVINKHWFSSETSARQSVAATGLRFTEVGNELVALANSGKIAEAREQRDATLRPAFDAYLTALTNAVDVLHTESKRANDFESEHTSLITRVLVGIASWPVLVLLSLLILTAAFLILLMVLFRGREPADMP